MHSIYFISLLTAITPLVSPSPLLAQSSNNSDLAFSYTCRQGNEQILVEVKAVDFWKSIIEQPGWTCTENTADVATGTLKFSCESKDDASLSLITVTWLTGEDEKREMGQWMHQFASEHSMFCSLATTELWDAPDQ